MKEQIKTVLATIGIILLNDNLFENPNAFVDKFTKKQKNLQCIEMDHSIKVQLYLVSEPRFIFTSFISKTNSEF